MSEGGPADGRCDGAIRASYRTRVEWIDTDAAGIYHNSTVARYVEAAETALMAGAGIVHDYFPVAPRVTYHVDFHAPLFFNEPVTTVLTLARLGPTSMRFTFQVTAEAYDGRPARLAASGEYVTVHIGGDHSGGATSAPWPAAWIDALRRHGDRAE